MVNNINNSSTANHKKISKIAPYILSLVLFSTVMLTNFVSLIFSIRSSSNGSASFFLHLRLE